MAFADFTFIWNNNSHKKKSTKAPMITLHFLHIICQNSDMLWTVLIILQELMNVMKPHIKKHTGYQRHCNLGLKYMQI